MEPTRMCGTTPNYSMRETRQLASHSPVSLRRAGANCLRAVALTDVKQLGFALRCDRIAACVYGRPSLAARELLEARADC